MKANILFLSYDGLTDPLGQSQILPYIGGLSEYGYRFTIVSFEKPDRFISGKNSIDSFCAKYGIMWHPLTYHKKPPIFSTIVDLLRLKRIVGRLHKLNSYRIIHCRSYLTALVGLWMKRSHSVKFIFDMRGFWADERIDGGLWDLRNPVHQIIYRYFKKKEKQFLYSADSVICLTENAKRELLNWQVSSPIEVIPCCVDLDHFNPVKISESEKNALRQTLGIKSNEFILLYLGSLGTWYLVKEMLDFFIEFKNLINDAKFLFVTPDKLDVDGYVYKHDIIICQSTRDKIPGLISLANASIVFIKPVFSKKGSSATKMAEVLAMGVPIVSNNGWGDVSVYAADFPGFVTVTNRNDYAAAAIALIAKSNSQEIREKASHYFALSNGIKSYVGVYEGVI